MGVARPHARLKHRLGYAEAALGELRAIYGWFTEGLELPDLLEPRMLLTEFEGKGPT